MPGSWASPVRAGAAFGIMMMGVASAGAAGSQPMLTGGLTSQPIGHYEFCKANPAECSVRLRDTSPLHLTDATWQEISAVNMLVNGTVIATEIVKAIPEIVELNIGHAIVSRAIFDGLPKAVRDMKDLMRAARR